MTSTVLQGLSNPVDLVMSAQNQLYVLTQGDGQILQYDAFLNPIRSVTAALNLPTALDLDSSGNFFVTELNGSVKRVASDGTITEILSNQFGLVQPQGIELLNNGLLAVAETGNHAIRTINLLTAEVNVLAGGNGPGFRDGAAAVSQFNQPWHVSEALNGALIIADRMNHRVRLLGTNQIVTTLYGRSPETWISDFPGWLDGEVFNAEGRQPVGVGVTAEGTIYSTEAFYHLVRRTDGTDFLPPSVVVPGPGGGTNLVTNIVVVPTPTLFPRSGYYPLGTNILITSSAPRVFYTTDGSLPTTNSLPVTLNNNAGVVPWRETLRDLTSLRVRAFDSTNASLSITGVPVGTNVLSVQRGLTAGIGSTVIVPILLNLRTNDIVRTLQFRVEISPDAGDPPPILRHFEFLSISPNDYIPLVTPGTEDEPTVFESSSYTLGETRGLAYSVLGTNANFLVEQFGAVAQMSIPIPPDAVEGDRYRIDLLQVSGTSDGNQADVPIALGPSMFITVGNVPYVVGDSALGGWYNSGDFGNGDLDNSDNNQGFSASLGVRTPHALSDVFDAMDSFPEDTTTVVGGDGQIRFLDWQLTLLRSLRLDPSNWQRMWSAGGFRVAAATTLSSGTPLLDSQPVSDRLFGEIWQPEAILQADEMGCVIPGQTVEVPIRVAVQARSRLGGLQFRIGVQPGDGAPALLDPIQFRAAQGVSSPGYAAGMPDNQFGLVWPILPSPSFDPPIEGDQELGVLAFRIPGTANRGDVYRIELSYADGSPDLSTQYDLDTRPGGVWVNVAPPPELQSAPALHGFRLRWFAEPAQRYQVQASADLNEWDPISETIIGSGKQVQYIDQQRVATRRYYRLILNP